MNTDNLLTGVHGDAGKGIYRSIYGLLLTVVLVLLSILIVSHLQNRELNSVSTLANEYHDFAGKYAREIVFESRNIVLWADGQASRVQHAGGDNPADSKIDFRDKIDSFIYVIQSRSNKILDLQKKYADPEFESVSNIFSQVVSDVEKSMSDVKISDMYAAGDMNRIIQPLIAISHQMQRLHEVTHSELESELELIRGKQKGIMIVIVMSSFLLGLIVVNKLLRNVRQILVEQESAHAEAIESRDRVRLLLDSTAEAIYGVDLDGNCTFANPACVQMLGYGSLDDLLGKNMHEVMHHTRLSGDPYPKEECYIYRTYLEGTSSNIDDEVFWRKDGSSFQVEYWSYPIKNNGEIVGSMVTFIDITERLQAKDKIARSEATMAEAQAIAGFGSWEWNIKNNELLWSDEIYRIFGADPQSFPATYDAFLEHIHPDDRLAVTSAVEASVADSNIPYKVQHRVIREDGQERVVQEQGVVYRDYDGQPDRMIGTVVDITEKIVSEMRLQKSQAEFSAMFESIPDVVVYADTGRKIQLVNSATVSLFGYSKNELSGNETSILYADAASFEKAGRENFNENAKPEGFLNEVVYKRKDGSTFIGETLGVPVRSLSGEVLGYLGIIRDITKRKASEEELARYRDGLEELVTLRTRDLNDAQEELVRKERLATLGQLTATISHELRNPLGAMRPSLYVINKKINRDDEGLKEAVDRVDRNISRCDHIIDELLDYTRITSIDKSPHVLDDWLMSFINEHQIPAEIKIETNFGHEGKEVLFDSNRLLRAVGNVVDNACHAMMNESTGEVSRSDACLSIVTRINQDRIDIIIGDNGSGIADEVLEKIFEPLYSTKGFGVGLGMSVVKQIMVQHGGGVKINTETGRGTDIILWLPLVLDADV